MTAPSLLLVEDNPDDIALAQRAVARGGVQANLVVARSGKEAWDMLNASARLQQQPKAVFLDLNMPEWSGFDLLERVRAGGPIATVPMIVLTTSNEPADVERSYKLGANSFITKPLDFKEFADVFAIMSAYWAGINETI
ncbi:MAG TPA: response regulator [Bryobacteraceae bacterium]|nr:response regulator [Bryobacteraceae bacterium]